MLSRTELDGYGQAFNGYGDGMHMDMQMNQDMFEDLAQSNGYNSMPRTYGD